MGAILKAQLMVVHLLIVILLGETLAHVPGFQGTDLRLTHANWEADYKKVTHPFQHTKHIMRAHRAAQRQLEFANAWALESMKVRKDTSLLAYLQQQYARAMELRTKDCDALASLDQAGWSMPTECQGNYRDVSAQDALDAHYQNQAFGVSATAGKQRGQTASDRLLYRGGIVGQ